jgi:hypothetical protein
VLTPTENKLMTTDRRSRLIEALLQSPAAREAELSLEATEIRERAAADLRRVEAEIANTLPQLDSKARKAVAARDAARQTYDSAEYAAHAATFAADTRRETLYARRTELQTISGASEAFLRDKGLLP